MILTKCTVWPKVGLYMHGSTIFLNHAPNDLDATSELMLFDLFCVAMAYRKHQLDTVKGSDCHC